MKESLSPENGDNQLDDLEPKQGDTPTLREARSKSLRNVRRELSEDELSTPGALRLLLDRIDRLEAENYELGEIRKRFHASDKSAAILRERLNKSTAQDIVLGAVLAAGSLIVGYVPSIWSSQPTGWVAAAIGTIMIVGTVIARLKLK